MFPPRFAGLLTQSVPTTICRVGQRFAHMSAWEAAFPLRRVKKWTLLL
jgi:hypothetical protein